MNYPLFLLPIITISALFLLPKNEVPEALRNYKKIVVNCTLKVINEPSEDVKRFDKLDDPVISKVMDGEIFQCVDKQMELFYENGQNNE